MAGKGKSVALDIPDKATLVPHGYSRHRITALEAQEAMWVHLCTVLHHLFWELVVDHTYATSQLLVNICRLSLPTLSFVFGYSPSLKKTKTPPLSKTDKPGKSPQRELIILEAH